MDGENTPAPARRGRPAKKVKNSAVYSDSGILVLTAEDHARLNDLNWEIDGLLACIEQHTRTAVQRLFEIGKLFWDMMDLDVMLKIKTCAELTGTEYHRASIAVRTYKKFCSSPEQLEAMTMSELMPLLRVKSLPEGDEDARQIQYAPTPTGGEEVARESFGIAPLSGVELRRYRIRANSQNGKYYLLEKECGAAIPIASLSVDTPQNAEQQAAFREMQDEIQCAMERYYAIIERSAGEYN